MTDTPKLTEAEAAILEVAELGDRCDLIDSLESRRLLTGRRDCSGKSDITPLGRAALAAFDAERRAKIESKFLTRLFPESSNPQTMTEVDERRWEKERRDHAIAEQRAKIRAKIRAEAIAECAAFTERQCGGAHGIDPCPIVVAKRIRERVKP